jgi:hypothetical protein
MRPESKANHLPRPSVGVKNAGAIPPRLNMASWNSTALIKDARNVYSVHLETVSYNFNLMPRHFDLYEHGYEP